LTILPTIRVIAYPFFQIQVQPILNITKDNNRNSQIENLEDFEIGQIIQPEILSVIEIKTKTLIAIDAQLV
jgi:hypothetical protein